MKHELPDVDKIQTLISELKKKDDLESKVLLGRLLTESVLEVRDYDQGIFVLEQAAEKGNSTAQVCLGVLYSPTAGIRPDEKLAMSYLQQATLQFNGCAFYELGLLYQNPAFSLTKAHRASKAAHAANLFDRAFFLLTKEFKKDKNNPDVLYRLGNIYLRGLVSPPDFKTAIRLFHRCVKLGATNVYSVLPALYLYGIGYTQNDDRCIQSIRRGILLGNVDCLYYLGQYYLKGQIVMPNYEEAFKIFSHLENMEIAKAYSSLGVMYEYGYYVQQDYVKAREYFEKALPCLEPTARRELGYFYHKGLGGAKDLNLAKLYYQQALAMIPNDDVTQWNYEELLDELKKKYTPTVDTKSMKAFAKEPLSDCLYSDASLIEVALRLWDGDGVAQDRERSEQILLAAAMRGNKQAVDLLQSLDSEIVSVTMHIRNDFGQDTETIFSWGKEEPSKLTGFLEQQPVPKFQKLAKKSKKATKSDSTFFRTSRASKGGYDSKDDGQALKTKSHQSALNLKSTLASRDNHPTKANQASKTTNKNTNSNPADQSAKSALAHSFLSGLFSDDEK